eukprot:3991613-Pleurochrysis_carterae.AAC.1
MSSVASGALRRGRGWESVGGAQGGKRGRCGRGTGAGDKAVAWRGEPREIECEREEEGVEECRQGEDAGERLRKR